MEIWMIASIRPLRLDANSQSPQVVRIAGLLAVQSQEMQNQQMSLPQMSSWNTIMGERKKI